MVARKVIEEKMTYRDAAKTYGLSHGSVAAIVKQYKHEGAKSKRNERVSKYKQEVDEYRQPSEIKTKSVSIYTICIGKKHSQAAAEMRGLCFEKTCSILKDSDCTSRGSKKIFDWYISSNTKK